MNASAHSSYWVVDDRCITQKTVQFRKQVAPAMRSSNKFNMI